MDLKRKAIRVGIAVSLCMLVSNLLKLKFPFFVLLPAVMPISTFFGETIKFGINRIIGSTIGAIIGVVFATIRSQNTLLVGLGVILIIYICNYLKWDSTTSIACLVFVSIIVGIRGTSAFQYSIHRLIDTFIGIAITTIVNNYIFNPDIAQLLKKKVKNIQEDLLNIANTENFCVDKNELDKIEWELYDMKKKLKICNEEFKFNKKFSLTKDKLESMIYSTTIIFEQIKTIDYINNTKNTNNTKPHINNIDAVISAHKNIFFNEIENLNKIINNIS
ncbi:aromatic acid exporter family protein [Clostridium botulinum]|uniref:FUSC family protein n=1 Tax=Clostridium botulinum TaxID=1491 RepID=UPI001A91EBDD|nr:aromatic acid exporter family protein [Clostridium botulinum]MBO0524254.1 aromatic acid exporter family protein [Clostridium botulinum]MBO0530248.1 aromatic acid exporter family protein [Clostridium botulinum]MBO0535039.1 aromatic acid exporter family protein [Clostridium botulinum]MBO0538801.1 aromatic acid exporter family protein [Clostridium botulinum]MBO0547461.1 aromatic acid exporter family protein [Clostridium botulinum]